VIHGSPHRFNILVVDAAPKFIDFETVELGPLEWDLAHLEPEVAGLYPGEFDDQALALCRVMVSAATSTWCWEGLERGSDMQSHAQHHLQVVRSSRT
jgi:aminoglycoside phosphotransferase (APT) family kinase protein